MAYATKAEEASSTGIFYILSGIFLLVVSLTVRWFSLAIITADYTSSIVHWFTDLSTHPGLSAFQNAFSDYTPLYLYFIKALTWLPFTGLYSIKALSVLFDVILSVLVYVMLKKTSPHFYSQAKIFFLCTIVFAIPTVVMNGSLWAQCDVIYTTLVVLSLYYIIRDRPLAASVSFALAFSLKLQAVFFLPFILGYILMKRERNKYLLVIPIIFVLTILPAVFAGGSFGYWFTVYAKQSGEFHQLTLFAPTIYTLLNDAIFNLVGGTILAYLGILLAAIAGLIVIIATVRIIRTANFTTANAILLALASVVAVPFFLPHMHERYFFLADVISLIYVFYVPRYWYIAVVIILASTLSYMAFLSGSVPFLAQLIVPEFIPGILMAWVVVRLGILLHRETFPS